jgi:opacity protein-like surface antigen
MADREKRFVAFAAFVLCFGTVAFASAQSRDEPPKKHPAELYALLGYGNAVCDKNKPDSDCPVDGALALGLGGDWRFVNHFAVGLELGIWSFHVREAWKGQLQDPATDVSFSSVYFAPFARWYWFDSGKVDPYLQAGIGLGSVTAKASNAGNEYQYTASGIAYLLGIGVDFQLSEAFRLGPQFLAYLHVSSKICETQNGSENCHSPGTNADGNREGLALPWRLVAVGTFTFGGG